MFGTPNELALNGREEEFVLTDLGHHVLDGGRFIGSHFFSKRSCSTTLPLSHFLLKYLFPITVWDFDYSLIVRNKNPIVDVRFNGMSSGEAAERGDDEAFRCALLATDKIHYH